MIDIDPFFRVIVIKNSLGLSRHFKMFSSNEADQQNTPTISCCCCSSSPVTFDNPLQRFAHYKSTSKPLEGCEFDSTALGFSQRWVPNVLHGSASVLSRLKPSSW